MIPRRVLAFRVRLVSLKGTADPAAMLKELERFVETCDNSDLSLLNVILEWLMVE